MLSDAEHWRFDTVLQMSPGVKSAGLFSMQALIRFIWWPLLIFLLQGFLVHFCCWICSYPNVKKGKQGYRSLLAILLSFAW